MPGVTDRRAIIRNDALGKQEIVSVPFKEMDEKLEILPVRPGTGHLYFASNLSAKANDADFAGRLAFRELAKPEAVADLLQRLRAR